MVAVVVLMRNTATADTMQQRRMGLLNNSQFLLLTKQCEWQRWSIIQIKKEM